MDRWLEKRYYVGKEKVREQYRGATAGRCCGLLRRAENAGAKGGGRDERCERGVGVGLEGGLGAETGCCVFMRVSVVGDNRSRIDGGGIREKLQDRVDADESLSSPSDTAIALQNTEGWKVLPESITVEI
ncbi:hypothetical protein Tco_0024126 [Tanacetum coccineum]